MDATERAATYVHEAALDAAPDDVADQLRLRVLDTLAAATAGYRFPGGEVGRRFATSRYRGPTASLLDGSGDHLPERGAVFANATAANVLDVDDGHRLVKGHPAAVVVPAALAAAEVTDATVGEFLDAVLVGYEVGVRAGLAIHEVDGVYTGSGSWGAVGAAAAAARLHGCELETTIAALGTAEYHAPRTPIMRGVAEPGMTKDGIGWGAVVGVDSLHLALEGFTASGTVFDIADGDPLADLGTRYHVTEGYFKPYPCCRWAQPGVEAALAVRQEHDVDPDGIEAVTVHTFEEATSLATRAPASVEEAEYSYLYPVAVALVEGGFRPEHLREQVRTDEQVRRVADRVELQADPDVDERFPGDCLARVTIETRRGSYESGVTRARGATERRLDATEIEDKARSLLEPTVPSDGVSTVTQALAKPGIPIARLLAPWAGDG